MSVHADTRVAYTCAGRSCMQPRTCTCAPCHVSGSCEHVPLASSTSSTGDGRCAHDLPHVRHWEWEGSSARGVDAMRRGAQS